MRFLNDFNLQVIMKILGSASTDQLKNCRLLNQICNNVACRLLRPRRLQVKITDVGQMESFLESISVQSWKVPFSSLILNLTSVALAQVQTFIDRFGENVLDFTLTGDFAPDFTQDQEEEDAIFLTLLNGFPNLGILGADEHYQQIHRENVPPQIHVKRLLIYVNTGFPFYNAIASSLIHLNFPNLKTLELNKFPSLSFIGYILTNLPGLEELKLGQHDPLYEGRQDEGRVWSLYTGGAPRRSSSAVFDLFHENGQVCYQIS